MITDEDSAIETCSVLVETDIEASERVSDAVVEAVAEAASRDPLDLQPLYDAIDPDALDALWSERRLQGDDDLPYISFEYTGYEVEVRQNQTVVVRELASALGA
ncbi:HalOD1 output domain-containing protein [Haladaptatus sp. NG-SE-30]